MILRSLIVMAHLVGRVSPPSSTSWTGVGAAQTTRAPMSPDSPFRPAVCGLLLRGGNLHPTCAKPIPLRPPWAWLRTPKEAEAVVGAAKGSFWGVRGIRPKIALAPASERRAA